MNNLKTTLVATASAVALLFSTGTQAQEQATPATGAAPTQPQPAQPALWKIADEDTTIYLFGTVHLLPEGLDWASGPIGDAMAASGELVTELGEMDEAQMAQVMGAKGMFTDGTTLRSLLSEDERARYEAVMGKLGAPAEAFDQIEPWMAAVTLYMIPLMQQGWTPEQGVEKRIDTLFDTREIDATGLETVEEQADFFDTLPQDVQVKYLMSVVDDFDSIAALMNDMLGDWTKGDVAGIASAMAENMGDPVVYKALLTDRNERWSVWIDDRLDAPGTVFVAVGAGHLAGADSVQAFLEQRGVEVTRVQ